jgi:hypothetical protein
VLHKEKKDRLISGRTLLLVLLLLLYVSSTRKERQREREGRRRRKKERGREKNAIIFATVHDEREQSADPCQLFSS